MALDQAILEAVLAGEHPPPLRFYTWDPPAVSLGHFPTPDAIDLSGVRERGWDVVRRPTGGRAVLHQHELTYSITLPPNLVGEAGVLSSYLALMAGLDHGVRQLTGVVPQGRDATCAGIPDRSASPNCFAAAAPCDQVVGGGKLVGSAQLRRGGALVQHGSLLLDAEPGAWAALFGSPGALVTLKQLLGRAVSAAEAAECLASGLSSACGVRLAIGELSRAEAAAAARTAREFETQPQPLVGAR